VLLRVPNTVISPICRLPADSLAASSANNAFAISDIFDDGAIVPTVSGMLFCRQLPADRVEFLLVYAKATALH